MHDRLQATSVAQPSTCTWLLSHPSFQAWSRSPTSASSARSTNLLWIKGHPGTGKSTLMAFLHNRFSACYPQDIHISFFFHANGTSLQKSQLGMLRSLIHQLYRWIPSARAVIFGTYKDKVKAFGEYGRNWEWQVEELRKLLSRILCMTSFRGEELVIFVDALDEVENEDNRPVAGELVEYFHALNDLIIAAGATTRICVSCRHYPVVATNQGLVINVEEENMKDVARYVEYHLKNGVKGWDQESDVARRALEQAIVVKAEGVFLWARLRLPKVIRKINDGAWSLEMAAQLLESESNELFTQYEEIISQGIEVSLRKQAFHFLQWVCLSQRPLSVPEIRFAMACDDENMQAGTGRCEDTIGFVDSDARMLKLIPSLSGGLAEVRRNEHGTTVQLFHQTVTSFLQLRGLQMLAAFSDPAVMIASNDEIVGAGEQRLSSSCLNYLVFDDVLREAHQEVRGIETRLVFVQYAANYWMKHAENADRKGIKQNGLVERLISEFGLYDTWKLIHYETNRRESHQDCDLDLIHIMAASNIPSAVEAVLERGISIDDEDLQCNTALHYAARYGHEAVAKFLLKRGARLDVTNRTGGTPLKSAAAHGHISIVQLLLENCADINENTGYAGNALQTAAGQGNLELVTVLVECGADINACGGFYCTALQAAADGGHEAVVKFLIDQDADCNIQGGFHGCALLAAILSKGSKPHRQSIVELLLEYNVDIDLDGGEYGNALQAAIAIHDQDITRLLLSNGAKVNAQGGKFGTALQAASHSRDKALVELLLSLGAGIHAGGGMYGSAIQAAASINDNEEVILFLLQQGADVNQGGGYYGSALQAASACPGAQSVGLLLEHGADINVQGGMYGNVLQAAVYGANEEAAKMFLAFGSDINQSGGEYGSALQASIMSCKEEFILYLLYRGADVDAGGGRYGDALRAAVFWNREPIVKLLLNRGAKPNGELSQDEGTHTPLRSALFIAAGRGRLGIVKTLLEHGADVNLQGKWVGNALGAAITDGHKAVVELLLDNGADPDRLDQHFGGKFLIADGNEVMTKLLREKRKKLKAVRDRPRSKGLKGLDPGGTTKMELGMNVVEFA
ncbi:hypothetical protein ONS96_014411 [Cadophora gregata f. sp. sojae]|nr:hypothetical protein ONS96_014411 [Cadophora gregata f. sp. sojae]